jgi:DNA-binding NarL/FixJ family response regulator
MNKKINLPGNAPLTADAILKSLPNRGADQIPKNCRDKIRILLVDDHPFVRLGVRSILEAEPDMAVIGEACNGREAVHLTGQLQPDVVVIDLAMPQLNGLEAIRQIHGQNPDVKLLVLSAYNDKEYVRQVALNGGAGFLLKRDAADNLPGVIREVNSGKGLFKTVSARSAKEGVGHTNWNYRSLTGHDEGGAESTMRRTPLTIREAEVLQLIAEGLPNKGIASELGISIKTVEKHRQLIMYKLDIHDIAGLTRYAISRGMITTGVAESLPVNAL